MWNEFKVKLQILIKKARTCEKYSVEDQLKLLANQESAVCQDKLKNQKLPRMS